jgi:hypothetical protein
MLEELRRRIIEGSSDEGRHSEREKAPDLERSPAHFYRRGVVDGHASYASATLQAPDRRRVVGSVFGTAGRIWVNTTIDGGPQLPAGGYKASGFGREMGYAGLEEFTEIKSILYRLGKREPFFGSDWSR